ncbi:MAG: TetR/AcrR family transcriptional regulator [Sphingomonadales bacterium]
MARQLIAEKGYAGVTMRELAEKSGVAYKSLYDLYGSKDNLLGKAIEERLRLVFESIDRAVTSSGFQRLMDIIERTSAYTLEIPNLARALEPILASDPAKFSIGENMQKFHREALLDISRQGDLIDDANVDYLLHDVMLASGAVRLYWANGVIADEDLAKAQKFSAAKAVFPFLRGASRDAAFRLVQDLHLQLAGRRKA